METQTEPTQTTLLPESVMEPTTETETETEPQTAPETETKETESQASLDNKLRAAKKVRMNKLMKMEVDKLSRSEFTEVVAYRMGLIQHAVANEISHFGRDLESNKEKVLGQHNLLKTLIGFQSDIDSKIDALAELCCEKLNFPERELEDRIDTKRELIRRTGADDVIERGDIIWCDFTSEMVGEPGTTYPGQNAENWAVKIGNKQFYSEDQLLGQSCKSGTKIVFEQTFPEDFHLKPIAGKTIKFNLDILKVKVHTAVLEQRTNEIKEMVNETMEIKDGQPKQ